MLHTQKLLPVCHTPPITGLKFAKSNLVSTVPPAPLPARGLVWTNFCYPPLPVQRSVHPFLQKAFDTIDHYILLPKLYCIGTRGIVHDWFKGYLYNRSQYVCVSGMKSDRNFVSCGVPQGSVLGPLLFLLYVNDIGNSVPNIPRKLYTDDTNLFVYVKTAENLINNARIYISKLNNWFIHGMQ